MQHVRTPWPQSVRAVRCRLLLLQEISRRLTCSMLDRCRDDTGSAIACSYMRLLRRSYLTFTYFRRLCAPTSAAKTDPAASAAMPDADVPLTTLSRSAGSGMKAVSAPVIAWPTTMPLSSPFFREGSGNDAPT